MDQSKIENFERTYPNRCFPKFETLSEPACYRIRTRVCEQLGLESAASSLDVVNALHNRVSHRLGKVSEGPLDLRGLLEHTSVRRSHQVLVNWYRFDDIDMMDLDTLSRHFDDIWYPSVDDIEIFDESCSWFLSVSHDGHISLITLP